MPPRSPSRDLVDRFAGNRRYFAAATRLERWKWRLTATALAVAGVWLALGWLSAGGAAQAYSHGPLAGPHAAFDDTCEACHRSFSARDAGALSIFRTQARWLDLTCDKCHAGPAHHTSAKFPAGESGACHECHRDHGGKVNSLVRLTDAHCTKCHANLPGFHSGGATEYAAVVTDFAANHPAFKSVKNHARGLQFSHGWHMTPGQVAAPGGRGGKTLAELPANQRERYRTPGQADADLVQLACASCHQLDDGRGGAGGAYYQPINFDNHCAACHELKTAEVATPGGAIVRPFAVPHRKQPSELEALLRGEMAARLLGEKPQLLAARPDPGQRLALPKPAESRAFADELNGAVRAVSERLYKTTAAGASGATCTQCHVAAAAADGRMTVAAATRIPTVWFAHAKFDHTAHRATACVSCHPAKASDDGDWAAPESVDIPGIDNCRQCHAPGKVRAGCTDCHTYHGGEHPLRRRGATTRSPADPFPTAADFLRGTPAKP